MTTSDLIELRQTIQIIRLNLSLELLPKLKQLIHYAQLVEQATPKLEDIHYQHFDKSKWEFDTQLVTELSIRVYEYAKSICIEAEELLLKDTVDKKEICLFLKAWRVVLLHQTLRKLSDIFSKAKSMTMWLKNIYIHVTSSTDISDNLITHLEEIITLAKFIADKLRIELLIEPQFDCSKG